MVSNVYICSKLNSLKDKVMIKIEMNDFEINVNELTQIIAKNLNVDEQIFDLMCYGRKLSGDKCLNSYGIKNGTIIFVLKKVVIDNGIEYQTEDVRSKTSQNEIHAMVIALKTAQMNPSFRNMLDKLNETDVRENLMAVTPGLRDDSMIIAILQDPDLLGIYTDPSNIHKVLERHPSLTEAVTNLTAAFHEENISGPSLSNTVLRNQNYSLDAMSDDEEMSGTETPNEQQSQTAAAQYFANMLVNAFNQNQSHGVITNDMLSRALQQTQQQTQPQPTTSTGNSGGSGGAGTSNRNWSAQLAQIRDLGINDETVAIQALEMTNGDVQAAANLIFSQFN